MGIHNVLSGKNAAAAEKTAPQHIDARKNMLFFISKLLFRNHLGKTVNFLFAAEEVQSCISVNHIRFNEFGFFELFTVTKGVFEEIELDFEVKEADKSFRIWLEQENFKGTTCFRNVRINKQRPRSPYRVLEKRLLRAGKVLCNTEPGKTYRISIGNNAAGKVCFIDQDQIGRAHV